MNITAITPARTGSRVEKGAQERAALIAQSLELVKLTTQAHESICLGNHAEAAGYVEAAMQSRITLANLLRAATISAINA